MSKNSEISIDDLIKRIYKSYIEIKFGEFREIDRDLLLNDIGLLYTSIKNLYPNSEIPPIEFDLINKNSDENTTSNPTEEGRLDAKMDVENSSNLTNEHTQSSINLAIFDSLEELGENFSPEQTNLHDKKSDNTASPVLSGFQNDTKEIRPVVESFQSLPLTQINPETEVSTEINSVVSEEVIEEMNEEPIIQTPHAEMEKKSTGNVIDFLHHEDKHEQKDIYSFLDLNTRIGLIELFFKGSSMEFTDCIIRLNKLQDKDSCLKIINKYANEYGISEQEDIYKQFVNLIERKLNSR